MTIRKEKEETISLIEWGPVLGSAQLGAEIRQKIEKKLSFGRVILDFAKVRTVTGAFVQECFEELFKNYKTEVLGKKIVLRNLNNSTASLIKNVLKEL